MNKAQVIVVGAGPAGSTAATMLARSGISVVLLEKRTFPRDKLCGGFLASRTLELMDVIHGSTIPDKLYHDTREQFAIHHNGTVLVERELGGRMAFVQRCEFDEFLARQASSAGAELREAAEVRQVIPEGDSMAVHLKSGEVLYAEWVVAADGALSRLRRAFAPGEGGHQTALEMTVPCDKMTPARLDFGLFPWGYAWDFPKRGLRTVGVCGPPERTGEQRELLEAYRKRLGLPEAKVQGWPLPDRAVKNPVRGRLVLIGDAAGLCEPLSGEGIYYAMRSGERAALTLLKVGLDGSTQAVSRFAKQHKKSLAFVYRQLTFARYFRPLFYRPGFQQRMLQALVYLPDLKDLEWTDVMRVAFRVAVLRR